MQKPLKILAVPLLLALITGVPAFAQTHIGAQVGSVRIHIARDAPPRNRVEIRTHRPSRNHQWINGYWERQNDQWAWSGGRWEQPSERGARWIKPKYHKDHDGYHYTEGRWSH
jgi:hypothetical protein